MAWKPPKVSIGLPVRNVQDHLAGTLDSILAQTFEDFELIISDNASTDNTAAVCVDYASRDPRIRYVRLQREIGPAEHHNSAVELACGQYFRWHEPGDTIAPDYLARCVKVLDEDPSVGLVYPQAMRVDHDTVRLGADDPVLRFDCPNVIRRFRRLILARSSECGNLEIYGLMRWSALRETPLMEPYAHGDHVLAVRLALIGRLRHIRKPLFTSRYPALRAQQTRPTRLQRHSRVARYLGAGPLPPPHWWNPSLRDRIVFPQWNLLRQYWRCINDSPITGWPKMLCRFTLAEWTLRNGVGLARDVGFAGEAILDRFTSRLRRLRKRASLLVRPRHAESSGAELKLS